MAERFLKFIPSKEALRLLTNHGHAFRLLTIIAEAARRYDGDPDGLNAGEALIGGHEKYGMSEQNYRTAKKILVQCQHIKILETNRNRKKVTTGVTTDGTRVKLLSSNVWDINSEHGNDRPNDCLTTAQRLPNDELRKKEDKKEKSHHPYPSFSDRTTDDLSSSKGEGEEKIEVCEGIFLSKSDLDMCIKIKGSIEKVKEAIEFIQGNKKRKYPIDSWPNALSTWKIENKAKVRIEDNLAKAESLCKSFEEFHHGDGWRCLMWTDREKDQRGVLFQPQSPYKEAIFIALIDGEFEEKCEKELTKNHMRKI
jgi:hypothetical protein